MNEKHGFDRRRDDEARYGRSGESRSERGSGDWRDERGSSEGRYSSGQDYDRGRGEGSNYGSATYGSEGGGGWSESSRSGSSQGFDRGEGGSYGQSFQGRSGWEGRGRYEDGSSQGWLRGQQSYGQQEFGPQGYGRQGSQGYGREFGGDRRYRGGQEDRSGSQGYGSQGSSESQGSWGGSYDRGEGADFGQQRYAGSYGFGYSEGQRRGGSMTGGRFSGKGPKGYTRSDERIKEQVSEKLEENGEVDASEITVQVQQGEITLEGTVPDRRMKRMAEDVAEGCPGVKNVQNRLRVEKDDGSHSLGSSTSSKDRESSYGSSATSGSTSGTSSEKNPRSRSTI